MEKNLNVEPVEGSYIRRNNLPSKKIHKADDIGSNTTSNNEQSAIVTTNTVQNAKENTLRTMNAGTILNASNTEIVKHTSDNQTVSMPSTNVEELPVLENTLVERPIIVPKPADIKEISLNEFYLNGKHIKFNKWKVKTRSELNLCNTFAERRKVLVYDLLEEFVPLDVEEFNYVLYRIRDFSYNTPIKYTITCNECGRDFDVAYKLCDLYRPMNGYSQDVTKEHTVNDKTMSMTFSHISVKDFEQYESIITAETDEFKNLLIDFIYHIKYINGLAVDDRVKLFKDIEEWDADIFENFFFDFNSIKFYVDVNNRVKCPHCLQSTVLNFDEFPNFYPDSWSL